MHSFHLSKATCPHSSRSPDLRMGGIAGKLLVTVTKLGQKIQLKIDALAEGCSPGKDLT